MLPLHCAHHSRRHRARRLHRCGVLPSLTHSSWLRPASTDFSPSLSLQPSRLSTTRRRRQRLRASLPRRPTPRAARAKRAHTRPALQRRPTHTPRATPAAALPRTLRSTRTPARARRRPTTASTIRSRLPRPTNTPRPRRRLPARTTVFTTPQPLRPRQLRPPPSLASGARSTRPHRRRPTRPRVRPRGPPSPRCPSTLTPRHRLSLTPSPPRLGHQRRQAALPTSGSRRRCPPVSQSHRRRRRLSPWAASRTELNRLPGRPVDISTSRRTTRCRPRPTRPSCPSSRRRQVPRSISVRALSSSTRRHPRMAGPPRRRLTPRCSLPPVHTTALGPLRPQPRPARTLPRLRRRHPPRNGRPLLRLRRRPRRRVGTPSAARRRQRRQHSDLSPRQACTRPRSPRRSRLCEATEPTSKRVRPCLPFLPLSP